MFFRSHHDECDPALSLEMPGSKTEIRPEIRDVVRRGGGPGIQRAEEIKTGNGETIGGDEIYDPEQIC